MEFLIIFFSILALIIIVPALAPALLARSWKKFLVSLFFSFFGITFPLFIFVGSMYLIPEWRGGGRYGWFDCFHMGKLILLPLVLWACTAFYANQILRVKNRFCNWIVLGFFMGAIVSIICFVFGLAVHAFDRDGIWMWLFIPLYVAVWYSVLCVRAVKVSDLGVRAYKITAISFIPFWCISLILSWITYLSLSKHRPSGDCFVVTSALRGHKLFVGPFCEVERKGVLRVVNRQLITFWKFEDLWCQSFPLSHQLFRSIYNWIGPKIARRINSQIVADIIYFIIKPFELVASLLIYLAKLKSAVSNQI